MTKDEVKKLRMNSPESLQFLNNATKFYNLMMMYRCWRHCKDNFCQTVKQAVLCLHGFIARGSTGL